MLSKWSAKPADHKAARLRNNQRCHRKRVKDHIAELESRLADTQLQLSQALVHINELSEKLQQARMGRDSMQLETTKALSEILLANNGANKLLISGNWLQADIIHQFQKNLTVDFEARLVQHGVDGTHQQTSQPNPSLELTGYPSPIVAAGVNMEPMQASVLEYEEVAYGDMQDQMYCKLPPPGPGESTTRCRDAYLIIIQQNRKGLNDSSIRGWLEPGFRGPMCEGDGCRIETGLLFALLDFISSSEPCSS